MLKPFLLLILSFFANAVSSGRQPQQLPIPESGIIEVSPGDDLRAILLAAPGGSTILLNSGVYRITQPLFMNTDSLTIMSKARHRDSVVLDGNLGGLPLNPSEFVHTVVLMRASYTTLAHLTISHAKHHGIHSYPPSSAEENIRGVKIYDVRVHDCGEQLIKVNSNGNSSNLRWVDDGRVEFSLIEFTNNSVMRNMGHYFYTGGVDVHGGYNWIISNNVFKNIERDATLMEHAVHFWSKSRGTLVENNLFVNVYRGIGFGMKTTENGNLERHYDDGEGTSPYFDHIDGIIRNNLLYNEAGVHLETGIELMNVKNVQVYNNTIFSVDRPYNSMEYRWPNTTVIAKNNLLSYNIRPRDNATADTIANIQNAGAGMFVNPEELNFRLGPTAINAIGTGVRLPDSLFGVDMGGKVQGEIVDVGAYQHSGTEITKIAENRSSMGGSSTLSNFSLNANGISFYSSSSKDLHIRLYSVSGKFIINQQNNSPGLNTVDLVTIPDGIYFLKISGDGEEMLVRLHWKR
jgi:hypothetical protein